MGFFNIVVDVVGLVHLPTGVQACSCVPVHPQDIFCDPKRFVIAVYVKSSTVIPGQFPGAGFRKITVNVLADFKNMVPSGDIVLTTAEQSATCGVTLELNKCYVVSGYVSPGPPVNYNINSCGFIKKCSQVTFTQWSGFFGEYKKYCGCKIGADTQYACSFKSYDIRCLSNNAICRGRLGCPLRKSQYKKRYTYRYRYRQCRHPYVWNCHWSIAANPAGNCRS